MPKKHKIFDSKQVACVYILHFFKYFVLNKTTVRQAKAMQNSFLFLQLIS